MVFFLSRHQWLLQRSILKRALLTLFVIVFGFTRLHAQSTTSCFEINSILADACSSEEPDNEMVFFTIGPNPLNVSAFNATWPTGTHTFQGIEQNATTASLVAGFNASVLNPSCGQIIEPTGGILPAGSKVVLVMGTQANSSAYSFANLTGTLYMIFQSTTGTSVGYFKNWDNIASAYTPRNISIDFGAGCAETISYIPHDLVNINGLQSSSNTNGALAQFDSNGNVSYANYGCQVPSLVFNVNASPTTICPSGTTTVTCNVVSGYYVSGSWSGGSGTFADPNSLITTYTASSTATGTETLTFSINNGCTIVSQSLQITLSASSPLTISGPTSTCSGSPITLTASGASSYLWSTGASTASISVSAGGTYTVTGTSSCGTALASQVVTAGSSPTVVITPSGPTSFCAGGSVTLTASGADTYLWSTGATSASIAVNSGASYSVTGTNPCGTDNASQIVTLLPLPTAAISASGSTSICPGNAVNLTASGGGSYLWSNGATTAVISVSTATTYTVTVTNSCGSDQASQLVSASASPSVAIALSGSSTLCPSATLTLTASGASTYLWSTGATTPAITVNAGGPYSVVGTSICGTANASQSVSIAPLPSATIVASGSTSLCPGASVTLTASGGSSYLWSTGATTSSILVSTPASYSVTASNSCGSDTANQTVVALALPSVSIAASGATTLCPGSSLTLTASGADTYSWSTGANTAAITVNTTATYSVTGTNTCGTDNASQFVSSLALPVAAVAVSGSTTLCPGASTTLTASGAASYSWSTGSTTDTIVVSSAGIFSVTATNFCGTDIANQIIDLLNPVAASIACSGSPSICPGSSVTLTASGTGTYVWSTGAATAAIVVNAPATYSVAATTLCGVTNASLIIDTLSSAPVTIALTGNNPFCTGASVTLTAAGGAPYAWSTGETTPTITASAAGSYTVTGNAPCAADIAQVVLVETPLPSVSISPRNPVLCPAQSLLLSATAIPSCTWSTGATASSIAVTQPGIYSVFASNLCGLVKDSVMVIASQVQASFNENVISGDAPLSVDFTNTSLQAASYVWRFDDGTTLSSEDMTHLFEQPGDYPVWLIATDANGCDDSLMHIIHVEAAGYMYVPTAFSPNGDGLNDEFRIIGNGIVSMEAQIFSRWGNPIYTIADLHSGWDGTERLGAPCPAGAYVYIVHAEFVDGHRQDMHGFINLIR